MKTNYEMPKLPLLIICVIIIALSTFSCKEEAPIVEAIVLPDVTTEMTITNITGTTATGGGLVENDKGETVTARGLCWSSNVNPTIKDSIIVVGKGIGSCNGALKNLTPNTTYYMRAYASNSKGTAYGSAVSFVTKKLATIITTEISNITLSTTTVTAASGGSITDDGGNNITARGVCWSTTSNPTIANNKTTDGSGIGNFISSITGLTESTTYYVRAYATTIAGTVYGNTHSFITGTRKLATVITTEVSNISFTVATSGGVITDDGGNNITARGVCWSTTDNPTIENSKSINGSGKGTFNSFISELTSNTTFYIRAYATNIEGTSYGNTIQITTSVLNPINYGTMTDIDGNEYKTI